MKNHQPAHVLIFIAPGFDEKLVVNCLCSLREAGLAVSVTGLIAGMIKGRHGLKVQADLSVDRLSHQAVPRLVLIPGNVQCASALVSDPRVYQFLEKTLAGDGFIAVSPESQGVLSNVGFAQAVPAARWVEQELANVAEFASQMVSLVAE
jgi:putative intracellular protease/amidase